ncbi:MAG: NusA N-terminal domain-containing protein, partial [Oscillospiraceae bacterium]
MMAKITKAIESAVKKDYEVDEDRINTVISPENGKFAVTITKDVVDEMPRRKEKAELAPDEKPEPPINLNNYILTADAQEIRKSAKAGGQISIPLKTKEFGRIAAQTAKHVIRQGLREAERDILYTEMQSKAHEIVSATVMRVDEKRGAVLQMGKGEAILPKNEQVPGEVLREGSIIKVYVVEVTSTERGPKI